MRAITRITTESIMILGLSCFVWFMVDRWLALFLALTCIMAVFPVFDKFAYWRREAIVFGVVWYSFLVLYVDNTDKILNALCILSIVNCVFVFLQAFECDPYRLFTFGVLRSSARGQLVGLMFNSNEVSALLAVCLPAFFRKKFYYFIPFIVLAIILAKSSSAVLAVGAVLVVYSVSKTSKLLIAPIYAAAIGLIFVYAKYYDNNILVSIANRLNFVFVGIEILKDNLLGVGLGHWHVKANQLHAHNDILQMAVEAGVAMFVVIIGYIVKIIRKTDILGGMFLASIIVISTFSFAWFIPTTALAMISVLAVISKRKRKDAYSYKRNIQRRCTAV